MTDSDNYTYNETYEGLETSGLQVGLGTQSGGEGGLAIPTGSSSPWMGFVSVALALVFVLFLAYVAARLMNARNRGSRSNKNMRIVEALGVSPQATVQLIKAGDKYFVLGVSRQGITAIGEVDAEGIKEEAAKPLPEMPFEKYLQRFTKKKDEAPKNEE